MEMNLERSKEWWLAKADIEGKGAVVAAGKSARDPVPDSAVEDSVQSHVAFSRFVSLARRKLALTIEEFAEKANLDTSEVLAIEDDIHYVAKPRAVYRLAEFLDVPQPSLIQLAGLSAANDTGLGEEAVRFAARSESVERLTDEELAAFEAFIAVLSKEGSSNANEESSP